MSIYRDKIEQAAQDRDRQELGYLARHERREYESYLRYEGRSELTPSEYELAERIARDEGIEL